MSIRGWKGRVSDQMVCNGRKAIQNKHTAYTSPLNSPRAPELAPCRQLMYFCRNCSACLRRISGSSSCGSRHSGQQCAYLAGTLDVCVRHLRQNMCPQRSSTLFARMWRRHMGHLLVVPLAGAVSFPQTPEDSAGIHTVLATRLLECCCG